MNLIYDPSITCLRCLVNSAAPMQVHNLVLDYDGEVIIDPETKFTEVELKRYKLQVQIPPSLSSSTKYLQNLLKSLLDEFYKEECSN